MASKKKSIYSLIHPIYLDTPMMLSFVATLEDGVSMGRSIVENSTDSKSSEIDAEGGAGTPEILSVLGLKFETTGQLMRTKDSETAAEHTFTRQHTMASLLSRMLQALRENKLIKDGAGFDSVAHGDLISFEAAISVNPLDQMLNSSQSIMALLKDGAFDGAADKKPIPQSGRGSNGGKHKTGNKWQETDKMIQAIRDDQNASPFVDLVGEGDNFTSLITADRSFFGDSSREALVGGRFKVVGKVTGLVSEDDEPVSLLRRGTSSLGPMREAMEATVRAFNGNVGGDGLSELSINGPVVQLLPLAIYI